MTNRPTNGHYEIPPKASPARSTVSPPRKAPSDVLVMPFVPPITDLADGMRIYVRATAPNGSLTLSIKSTIYRTPLSARAPTRRSPRTTSPERATYRNCSGMNCIRSGNFKFQGLGATTVNNRLSCTSRPKRKRIWPVQPPAYHCCPNWPCHMAWRWMN